MLEYSIIFIAGVHGAGKGFVSSYLSDKLGFPSYSASSLIRAEKKSVVDVNKRVVGADENQDYLLSALAKLRPSSDSILLDGHFCLQGSNQIIDVPFSVFQAMKPKALVVLHGEPDQIVKRLLDRDGGALAAFEIKDLQEAEVERARMVSTLLRAPLLIEEAYRLGDITSWVEGV